MSQQELEKLYQRLHNCQKKTVELAHRVRFLEEKKDQIPFEVYLEKFEQIKEEAQELNLEKERIGRKIESLSSEYDS